MKSISRIKHLHISPRKCRLVADLIKGAGIASAEAQLNNLNKKAAQPVLKLLNNAVSSAEHNKNMVKDNLYIKDIYVGEGTTMKRWQPRAFGRAYPINKRASHITLVLDEKVKGKKGKQKKAAKTEDEKDKADKKDKKKKSFDKKDLRKNIAKGSDKGVFKKIFRRKSV